MNKKRLDCVMLGMVRANKKNVGIVSYQKLLHRTAHTKHTTSLLHHLHELEKADSAVTVCVGRREHLVDHLRVVEVGCFP